MPRHEGPKPTRPALMQVGHPPETSGARRGHGRTSRLVPAPEEVLSKVLEDFSSPRSTCVDARLEKSLRHFFKIVSAFLSETNALLYSGYMDWGPACGLGSLGGVPAALGHTLLAPRGSAPPMFLFVLEPYSQCNTWFAQEKTSTEGSGKSSALRAWRRYP